MSADALKSLVESYPALRAVAFADLSTRMVLVSESRTPMLREAFQTLCLTGGDLLTAVDGDPIDPETACDLALSVGPDEIGVFLRVPGAQDDALCCLCDPALEVDAFVADARACLDRLVGR